MAITTFGRWWLPWLLSKQLLFGRLRWTAHQLIMTRTRSLIINMAGCVGLASRGRPALRQPRCNRKTRRPQTEKDVSTYRKRPAIASRQCPSLASTGQARSPLPLHPLFFSFSLRFLSLSLSLSLFLRSLVVFFFLCVCTGWAGL